MACAINTQARGPSSSYLMALEDFSPANFTRLAHWLGFGGCEYTALPHANRGGGYSGDSGGVTVECAGGSGAGGARHSTGGALHASAHAMPTLPATSSASPATNPSAAAATDVAPWPPPADTPPRPVHFYLHEQLSTPFAGVAPAMHRLRPLDSTLPVNRAEHASDVALLEAMVRHPLRATADDLMPRQHAGSLPALTNLMPRQHTGSPPALTNRQHAGAASLAASATASTTRPTTRPRNEPEANGNARPANAARLIHVAAAPIFSACVLLWRSLGEGVGGDGSAPTDPFIRTLGEAMSDGRVNCTHAPSSAVGDRAGDRTAEERCLRAAGEHLARVRRMSSELMREPNFLNGAPFFLQLSSFSESVGTGGTSAPLSTARDQDLTLLLALSHGRIHVGASKLGHIGALPASNLTPFDDLSRLHSCYIPYARYMPVTFPMPAICPLHSLCPPRP